MADAALVATIVLFFVVTALLVRALGRVTAAAAEDAPSGEESPESDLHPEFPELWS
jgi:hypothetical protein